MVIRQHTDGHYTELLRSCLSNQAFSANPIITISPLPLRGLAETSQAAVRLDSSNSGRGAAPLQPQAPVTCLAGRCLHPPCRSRTFPFLCHHLPTPRRQPSLLPLRLWTQPPAQRNPSPATPHNLLLYFYLLYKPVCLL